MRIAPSPTSGFWNTGEITGFPFTARREFCPKGWPNISQESAGRLSSALNFFWPFGPEPKWSRGGQRMWITCHSQLIPEAKHDILSLRFLYVHVSIYISLSLSLSLSAVNTQKTFECSTFKIIFWLVTSPCAGQIATLISSLRPGRLQFRFDSDSTTLNNQS